MFPNRNTLHRCASALALALLTGPALADDGDCTLPAEWLNGSAVPDPSALPNGSAFDNFNSFCKFNQWAWNAFLFSMQETTTETGETRLLFETYPTQEQTVAGSWSKDDKVANEVFMPRLGKANHPIDAVAQAGTTGILVAQANNRAVYYSQHINPVMYNQIIRDNWNNAKGIFDETVERGLFDIGSIEYKAAWAIVDGGLSVPGAYTRPASVPKLKNITHAGTNTIGVPGTPADIEYEDVTVALVALHVVGWVNGHTEAIWASFSPANIAPVMSESEITHLDKTGAFSNKPVEGATTAFFTSGTAAKNCNKNEIAKQVLDEATQTLSFPTQACQVFEFGVLPPFMMKAKSVEATDRRKKHITAIQQLNKSAQENVPPSSAAAGYEEIGAVWTTKDNSEKIAANNTGDVSSGGDSPTSRNPVLDPDKLNKSFQTQEFIRGSTVLSNPVIETFTQTDAGQNNCFSCHNSLQFQPDVAGRPDMKALKPSMLNLSHFLMQIYMQTYDETMP